MAEVILAEESVKLYEYEQSKPDLDDDFLEHHGILGMHWGQRNGPPYPLGRAVSTGKRLKAALKAGSIKRKRRKALKKARKARAQSQKVKTFEKQTKENIIKNKDIKSMLNNVDKFSNQEINDMLTRLDTERRLAEKVREYERAHRTTGQKIKEGIKESAKEGAARGGKQLIKTASQNGVKWAAKKVLTELGGKDTKIGYEKWAEIVNKLLKEEKK